MMSSPGEAEKRESH